ncbi:anaphase-promoting complex subunit 5 [Amborella trichopoda]|uniref:anaphase-promoting complex subunit 5 n=1 Tax=Amborella trichopoda TaxID=13333 RepID=UPI0009BCC871|nr:anaphase-promoting complex subunit 5 [Amborella trichopoda]|eukprot:XP_020528576.1 anaphase-promoting complex subunit 5 [Amborella trichopoda]
MAGNPKSMAAFNLTPHKVSVCILIQLYSSPASGPVPFPFLTIPQHNRFGVFLFSLTKACDNFLEPPLEELISQLKATADELNEYFLEQLTSRLSSLTYPDDLHNFFISLRGQSEDNQILLDPNSNLGLFIRRCILAFNLLPFEGLCHLMTNIETYCRPVFSSCSNEPPCESPRQKTMSGSDDDDYKNDSEFSEDEKLKLDSDAFEKQRHVLSFSRGTRRSALAHLCGPRLHFDVDEAEGAGRRRASYVPDPMDSQYSHDEDGAHDELDQCPVIDVPRDDNRHYDFLRTNWQVQGYLRDQADLIERHPNLFPMNAFEAILKELQKLAPELHRAYYLRYLNGLYHDDFLSALDNLHHYFDYRYVFWRMVCPGLCWLGCLVGHPTGLGQGPHITGHAWAGAIKNHDDSCLAYSMAAVCDLLFDKGVSTTTGMIGSTYLPGGDIGRGSSLSTQQQLLVLLKKSLKSAESLKLTRLVAFNRLALAKFDLKRVKRSLVSFGPKAPIKLRSCPIEVCKELRLSSYLLSEFGSDGSSFLADGIFSTAWLNSLQKSELPSIMSSENGAKTNDDAFYFAGQPSPIPACVLQLAGTSYLLKCASWESYGSSPLVRLNALVHATCFADAASTTDLCQAYVKLIQHMAMFKGYKEAFTALKFVEKKFSSLSGSRIQLLKLQLLHDRALHRGQLKLAQQVCNEFGVLASSISGVDMDLKAEASLRHARTLLAANQFSEAASVAYSLFCMCHKFNMQVENASVHLLLAEVHKKSGNAVSGLPYALASLSFCQSFNLDLLEASATLTLAELWLSLGAGQAKRALMLLYRSMPILLGHGGLELRARANIALAKCHLSDSSFSVFADPGVVLDPLGQAADELQILEYHELAAEAFYLMAMVYNMLGRTEDREAAAASFKEHLTSLNNPETSGWKSTLTHHL